MLAWKQPLIQRVRNSSLVERPNCGIAIKVIGRGAFRRRRRSEVTSAGDGGKANAGISNDKRGEKPRRRKTKGSRATLIGPG